MSALRRVSVQGVMHGGPQDVFPDLRALLVLYVVGPRRTNLTVILSALAHLHLEMTLIISL